MKVINIYEKIQKIKLELLECNLKKSGGNKYAGFKYYELADIMPDIIRLCDKYKVCTLINFLPERATLEAVNCEKSDELNVILIESPVEKLELKGNNAIQALGGVQT